MNRRLYQFLYSSVPMLTMIDCKILIGASGAVSSFSGNLVQSVTHDSTGHYTITLKPQSNLNSEVCFLSSMRSPSDGTPSGIMIVEKSPLSNISASTPTIVIQCFNDTDSLADPANGSRIELIQLGSNSSSQY